MDDPDDPARPSQSMSTSVFTVHAPPTRAEIFHLETSAPPPAFAVDDPRVSLRPGSAEQDRRLAGPDLQNSLIDQQDEPQTLTEFRKAEDPAERLSVFRRLFDSIPIPSTTTAASASTLTSSSQVPALAQSEASTSAAVLPDFVNPKDDERSFEAQRTTYARELWRKCSSTAASARSTPSSSSSSSTGSNLGRAELRATDDKENARPGPSAPLSSVAARWTAFERYADEKEKELWRVFVELDADGDMRLRKEDVKEACRRADIELKDDAMIDEFIKHIDRDGDGSICFQEWRDFLLLLPRPTSMSEVLKYYQTHRSRRPSMSRLTQDGDVVVGGGKSSWDKLAAKSSSSSHHGHAKERSTRSTSETLLRDSTNLKQLETENDERKFATECRRARNARLKERAARSSTASSSSSLAAASAVAASSSAAASSGGASANAENSSTGLGLASVLKGKAKAVDQDALPQSSAASPQTLQATPPKTVTSPPIDDDLPDEELDEDEEEAEIEPMQGMFAGAGKFLLAGGVAGAVSRTATAPFDRLKVYLITSGKEPAETPGQTTAKQVKRRKNAGSIPAAVRAVWKQGGGVKAFWTGNGLNVIKIFPESAIKFLSYESAKRVFAQYWDHVPDQTMISNSSRFVAGGIGGVVSQFVIYPIESLKTRVMSSTGGALRGNMLIAQTAMDMWSRGGIQFFFRGLPAGLVGVFPYSAIDMSTFEGIKLAYTKWAGAEPGVAGSLAFGAISGGIGATSVYPLNVIRTRLQAQGTPAHPQTYTGVRDAAWRCYVNDGWRGFYKGLTPTLVKVVPAVAISYAVYDTSKAFLFGREEQNCHALAQHQDDDSDES